MTLRVRLVLALMTAAVLPVAVAVGLPLLRAGSRAKDEAERRLELAGRQARTLLSELSRQTAMLTERAADDLGHDRSVAEALIVGPEERARAVARPLCERNGLDYLEIRSAAGAVLSAFPVLTELVPQAPAAEADPVVLALPRGAREGEKAVAFFVRRSVAVGGETFLVTGARTIDREALSTIEAITSGPVVLTDASARVLEFSGDLSLRERWITGSVPLGEQGLRVEIAVPPADVERERQDLLQVFAGVVPFALASALVVGILLAEGIVRPIRALASRAERIAAEHEGSFPLLEKANEVGRLTHSFDRMLAALAGSEHRRIAAERVAAWQEVARRIAHEVKNPLSPIQLAVENLRRTRVLAPESFDRSLEVETATILEEVESLKRLVDEFSEFARLPEPRIVASDLRAIVSSALALFSSRIAGLGVAVEVDTAGAPDPVGCDPEQIGRVLRNVFANALDALEPVEDRRLRVRVREASGPAGPMAEIEVRDTGIGFDPEALRRVFEPYFTTRSERGGTGLGMAIVHRIVSEHDGSVDVRQGPAKGATVTIRIPVGGNPAHDLS